MCPSRNEKLIDTFDDSVTTRVNGDPASNDSHSTFGPDVRTSSPATRGFGKPAFTEVADISTEARHPRLDVAKPAYLRKRVERLADAFPLYPNLNGGFQ